MGIPSLIDPVKYLGTSIVNVSVGAQSVYQTYATD
jgi:hypothetical protein